MICARRGLEMVEHAHEIARVIHEIERPLVIVALAVAARVPGDRMPVPGKGCEIGMPVALVAADSMQEHRQMPRAHVIDGNVRRRSDANRGPPGHVASPWFLEYARAKGTNTSRSTANTTTTMTKQHANTIAASDVNCARSSR